MNLMYMGLHTWSIFYPCHHFTKKNNHCQIDLLLPPTKGPQTLYVSFHRLHLQRLRIPWNLQWLASYHSFQLRLSLFVKSCRYFVVFIVGVLGALIVLLCVILNQVCFITKNYIVAKDWWFWILEAIVEE